MYQYSSLNLKVGTVNHISSNRHIIPQLDGNLTISSSLSSNNSYDGCCNTTLDSSSYQSQYESCYDESSHEYSCYDENENVFAIPVLNSNREDIQLNLHRLMEQEANPPPWFEQYVPRITNRKESKQNRITVRRDNRLGASLTLPVVSVSNMRSLMPKLSNFKNDMIERNISVALLSEVWEKVNFKKHQNEIEKMLQMDGLKYISTPRTTKRGGGAAIVVSLEKFSLEKIEVANPDKLEIIWGLLRPKNTTSQIKEIIVSAFYSPPKSRKNSKLLDHIMVMTQSLLTKYPKAGLVIGGDKNNLNITSLLIGIPGVRQIVTRATHKSKVLDIILTNLHRMYCVPNIVPPVAPDYPLSGAVPSDHSTPVATPITSANINQTKEYITKVSRPLPDSGIREFGQ